MKIEGYVYFIQGSNEEGLIKIGWAKDPIKRLADLQTACPIPLTLLGAKPGDVTDEKALHRKLAFARFHGEWFAPVPEVLDEFLLNGGK